MIKRYSLLVLLALLILFACKNEIKTENNTQTENKIIFKIDQRVEFFRILFNLAIIDAEDEIDSDLMPCNTKYLLSLHKYFKPLKNHPIVNYIYNNDKLGFDFPTIGLLYKNLDDFEFNTNYSKELSSLGLSKTEIDSLQPLFLDFYKKSNFKSFFISNKSFYTKAIKNIEKQVNEEAVFDQIIDFYQSETKDLELYVFVEMTNNANNKAVSFYDNYNPKKRAILLANLCQSNKKVTKANTILELDDNTKGRIYHETSHLFTNQLLDKYIGDLEQYKTFCKDCNAVQIKDKVDHLIIEPIQALLTLRLNNDNYGHDFFTSTCKDVRQEIYKKLSEYDSKANVSFETYYKACISILKEKSKKTI